MHSPRVTLPILIAFLTGPAPASAQVEIHVIPNDKFVAQLGGAEPSLLRFLTEGTLLRAETRTSLDVVLFVAQMSKGRVVAQGQSGPFRLDAKAASTTPGMRLGAALSEAQTPRCVPGPRRGRCLSWSLLSEIRSWIAP